jgi:hypothetical protein
MRHLFAWLLGGFALFGFLRRRHGPPPEEVDDGPDPRAEALRRKLEESRARGDERGEETDVAHVAEPWAIEAVPAPEDPEARRRAVHEAGREIADRMRERD